VLDTELNKKARMALIHEHGYGDEQHGHEANANHATKTLNDSKKNG
jgi:hypothetical protein